MGRRAVFAQSLGLFAAGSLLVAAAPSFELLLLGRAIQAFGAGGIFPVASAVIAETVPEERRGRTLGLIGAVFGLAFLLGPLLGGLLLRFSWRWLFLINVPMAAVLIVAGLRRLPSAGAARPRAFDVLGAVTLALALAAAVWTLSQVDAPSLPASLGSARIWPILVVAVLAAAAFWAVEKRAADPVLHPDLFRSRQLRVVGAIALAAGIVEAGMVFLPEIAVLGFGVSSSAASLMMLPLVLTLAVGAPIAGRLLDRNGARPVIQIGLMLTIVGLALYAWLPLNLAGFYASGAAVGFGLSALARRAAALRHTAGGGPRAPRRGPGAAHAVRERRPAARRRDRRRHRRVERDGARRLPPRVAHARVRLRGRAHAEQVVAR